ncbi:LOW QUALITY PROTEIN: hypothetical protein ACHAW5_000980 [Stephanodiscus triporus]|uniref:Uncharacterized protein n=1 Tax=Stephanodiscus triporus TaxID=2934178 RepID=A0ABD3NU61_9STRA
MDAVKTWAILNSGATSPFLTSSAPATNVTPTTNPIIARLPNARDVHAHMYAGHPHAPRVRSPRPHHPQPGLPLPHFGRDAMQRRLQYRLHQNWVYNFISWSHDSVHQQMHLNRPVDDTPHHVYPTNINAHGAPTDVLPTTIATNINATSTAAENARFIHQALCSPPAMTLLRALEHSKELATIPGFSSRLGHMRRHQQGTHSTRSLQPAILDARRQVDELLPTKEKCTAHDFFCFAALADLTTGTMYTDLPGAFPICSF